MSTSAENEGSGVPENKSSRPVATSLGPIAVLQLKLEMQKVSVKQKPYTPSKGPAATKVTARKNMEAAFRRISERNGVIISGTVIISRCLTRGD